MIFDMKKMNQLTVEIFAITQCSKYQLSEHMQVDHQQLLKLYLRWRIMYLLSMDFLG